MLNVVIRRSRPADEARIAELWSLPPYRPEDEGAKEVMSARARKADVATAREWTSSDRVAVLEQMRVDPDYYRRGIGTRLAETVIGWCRANGYRTLVLNTTSAQLPALALYRKVGFREAFTSFIGKYELVWFEMDLTS